MATENGKRARRAGTTLVELIVSMLLIEILAAMSIGVLGPATAAFAKLQKTITAQSVIDNISEEIAKNLQDITGNVRIYDADTKGAAADPTTGKIASSGSLLEYQNPDGYIVLLSADGCSDTAIYIGTATASTTKADAVNPGRLLLRYYAKNASDMGDYTYTYCDNSKNARARYVSAVFTDKYYMGSYLAVNFAYKDGQVSGESVPCLTVTVYLYEDEERTDLITSETTVVQLRYDAKCYIPASGETNPMRTAVSGS